MRSPPRPASSLIYAASRSLALSGTLRRRALCPAREALRLDAKTAPPGPRSATPCSKLGRYREAFAAFDRWRASRPASPPTPGSGTRARRSAAPPRPSAAIGLAIDLDPAGAIPEPRPGARAARQALLQPRAISPARAQAYRRALHVYPRYVAARRASPASRLHAATTRRGPDASSRRVEVLPAAAERDPPRRGLRRRREARRRAPGDALVGTIERLLRANGVRTEQQTALFDLDHGRNLAGALERARLAYREGSSVFAADVLAWALERNGSCAEALDYSKESLRLGTHDALKLLPPRDDRALPRPFVRARVVPSGARAEPPLLAPLVACGEAVRGMKRLALVLLVATACAFALGATAQAHPLGNFTVNTLAAAGLGRPACTSSTSSTSPRSRPSRRRARGSTPRLTRRRIAADTAAHASNGRPARLVAGAAGARLPEGRRAA